MCFFAIVYQLVVIGEAANMLTKEFRDEHPETPWREIVSMRNFIVHGYNVVDKTEVWSVIENDLGPLKIQIEQYYLLAMTPHRHGLGAWATAKNRSSARQKDVLKGLRLRVGRGALAERLPSERRHSPPMSLSLLERTCGGPMFLALNFW